MTVPPPARWLRPVPGDGVGPQLHASSSGHSTGGGEARPATQGSRERFFIITAGRTGSSLLCAILAAAGADFGMPSAQSWNDDEGAFEHPAVTRAAGWFRAAYDLSPVRPLRPRRWLWEGARHYGKRHLKRILREVSFAKAVNLDLLVPPAAKFGYRLRMIVSYRRFTSHALSLARRFADRDAATLETDYLRTYRNALLWLLLHGGCAVDYDELLDLDRTEWIAAICAVTGLSAEAIGAARRARLNPRTARADPGPALSEECECIYASLHSLRGQILPARDPSAPPSSGPGQSAHRLCQSEGPARPATIRHPSLDGEG